ncbi:Rhodanese-like protein [Myriangium duriaei CBS 260.36]|uniref:Rhodanese-like protein n=1 Tax=Myriangium duriaei CBS 260.36 TaxID=1168546 RepID=A0A9P4JBT2_9PEZI|nr:Rhodanese-like protein [Myriangium duriaei CBS 260.36]
MSNLNISTLQRISPSALATILRQPPNARPNIAIIDVRDSDYIGGHILGCRNVPVHTHDTAMPELVRTLRSADIVVFHCALSQQRGPASALRYARERERKGEGQSVVVLEGGFSRWQELYGEDKELTEAYQKDLWEYGY